MNFIGVKVEIDILKAKKAKIDTVLEDDSNIAVKRIVVENVLEVNLLDVHL